MASRKPAIHETNSLRQSDTVSVKWFRVLYRPYGKKGFWTYGWLFPSDSLIHANETVDQTCRVKDKYHWTYWVEEIDPRDFDYPKDYDSSTDGPGDGRQGVT